MGLVIASAIVIFVLIFVFYTLREAITGEWSPFSTVTFEDDPNSYQEIMTLVDKSDGPSVILKMDYANYMNPSYEQTFLILKSKEEKSRLTIKVVSNEIWS